MMDDDLFRQQASEYMARHSWHMKEQEARQRAQDMPWQGDTIDMLFGFGVFLFIVGFFVYAAYDAIFN